jgi:heptosyltransferase-2
MALPKTNDQPPATALVIQTAFLGDVVLSTPLLSALAAAHGPVDVVTTPAASSLLATHPAVRTVVPYDKRGADRGLAGLRRLGNRLRAGGYARVYLPHRSWRSAALALLARIPERVGFADAPPAVTYTRRVPRPKSGHETERLLRLAPDRQRADGPGVSLGLTGTDRARAADWLRTAGIDGRFIALAPGSIWGTKRWPGYAELARRLDMPVVVIGGPEDAALAEEIAAAAPGRVRSAVGKLPLRGSAALIERAAVLVTNDSAPLHLGTAVRTPIVAVFGPTVPEFGFGPIGPLDRALGVTGLPCRPCSAHGPQVCPLGHHRCMRELDTGAVLDAVRAIIHGEERSALRAGD